MLSRPGAQPHQFLAGFWRERLKGAKLLSCTCCTGVVANMNKLRSGRSYASASLDDNSSSADLKQSTIQFRKRRHPPPTDTKLKNTTETISDLLSPTKRSKPAGRSPV